LQSDLGKSLASRFSKPSTFRLMSSVAMGRPFWDSRVLGDTLQSIFENAGVHTLSDLAKKGTEVLVIATSLSESQRVVHRGDVSIVNALLDSAGIPFCFRTWKHGPIVDGGLCENLPLEELIVDTHNYGPVVAVSFEPSWHATPTSLYNFSLSLLDTAINNSVERARRRLGSESLFQVHAQVGTFEFQKAIGRLGHDYDQEYERARKFFKNFVLTHRRRLTGDPWSNDNVNFMKTLGKVYEIQHQTPLHYKSCEFVVTANCLLEQEKDEADEVFYQVTFHTLDQPIYCYRLALTDSRTTSSVLSESTWQVTGPGNREIAAMHLPAVDPRTAEGRYLLLFFNPVLLPNSGPYTLRFRDKVFGLMKGIQENGADELQWTTRRAGMPIEEIKLVLHTPDNVRCGIEGQAKGEYGGRKMTNGELAAFQTPHRFRSIGWIGKDIPPPNPGEGGVFGANVLLE
jgi:hypothetical protein